MTALLRNYGAFEETLCRHFVRQILQGLNYLHERDIIHRDIKGANILVDNKSSIKISDFGISKKVEDCQSISVVIPQRPQLTPLPNLQLRCWVAGVFIGRPCKALSTGWRLRSSSKRHTLARLIYGALDASSWRCSLECIRSRS